MTQEDVARLVRGMAAILYDAAEGIPEHCGGLSEGYPVLDHVARGFPGIPFEPHP